MDKNEVEVKKQNNPLITAFVNFIENSSVNFNYAASLTFRKEPINEKSAMQTARQFTSRYNAALGLKKFRKKSIKDNTKRAAMIGVLEGDGKNKRYHYHFALHKPENMSSKKFEALVLQCWKDSNNGSKFKNELKEIYSNGWIEYICKEFTRNTLEALDTECLHVY